MCEQFRTWSVAGTTGNVLLSSIGASIALIIVAQYTLNVMLVVRQSSVTAGLSFSAPLPGFTVTVVRNASVEPRRLHDDRSYLGPHDLASWTFARLPSIFCRRVLEYFNPGRTPASTERPKPLCPLPGI